MSQSKVSVKDLTLGQAYIVSPGVVGVFTQVGETKGFVCNPSFVGFKGKQMGVVVPFQKTGQHSLKFVQFPDNEQFAEYDGKLY